MGVRKIDRQILKKNEVNKSIEEKTSENIEQTVRKTIKETTSNQIEKNRKRTKGNCKTSNCIYSTFQSLPQQYNKLLTTPLGESSFHECIDGTIVPGIIVDRS